MNANNLGVKRVITANIPSNLFKLISKTVEDEIRIYTWQWLRILSRAKKIMKIKTLDEELDLEPMFKELITDSNLEIQKLGLAITCNFSIDFPGMIVKFKDFMPLLKDFITQDKAPDLKYFAIKTIKNLLYAGHPQNVLKDAEKIIFDWISIKQIYELLDDEQTRVKDQAVLIFKSLKQSSEKNNDNNDDDKNKSILDTIEEDYIKERIKRLEE